MTTADWFRWFAIIEGAVVCGFALAILAEARRFKAPPTHVVTVGCSYVVLTLYACAETHSRLGDPFGYRIFGALIAFSFGLVSMISMFIYYMPHRRETRHSARAEELAVRLLREQALQAKREDEGSA